MQFAGDERCAALIGTDDFANAAGSGNKDDIVFLFIDINVQQFESKIREGIKPYRPSTGQTTIVTRLSEKSIAMIPPKSEEDPRCSEQHGAA